jgi:hypothetical protein
VAGYRRKQVRPVANEPATTSEDGGDLPCPPWDEEMGIIASSHPLMPSPIASLYFINFFERPPCDFSIIDAFNRLSADLSFQ